MYSSHWFCPMERVLGDRKGDQLLILWQFQFRTYFQVQRRGWDSPLTQLCLWSLNTLNIFTMPLTDITHSVCVCGGGVCPSSTYSSPLLCGLVRSRLVFLLSVDHSQSALSYLGFGTFCNVCSPPGLQCRISCMFIVRNIHCVTLTSCSYRDTYISFFVSKK